MDDSKLIFNFKKIFLVLHNFSTSALILRPLEIYPTQKYSLKSVPLEFPWKLHTCFTRIPQTLHSNFSLQFHRFSIGIHHIFYKFSTGTPEVFYGNPTNFSTEILKIFHRNSTNFLSENFCNNRFSIEIPHIVQVNSTNFPSKIHKCFTGIPQAFF